MLIGRCCKCREIRSVTLKGMAASSGVTQWEYGPGSLWALHYGADEITGIKYDSTATATRAIRRLYQQDSFFDFPRSAGVMEPSAAESLTIVKLNSTTGAEIESATWAGIFTVEPHLNNDRWYSLNGSFSDSNFGTFPTGLSGGDYLIPCTIHPSIEWVDYSTNTANKEYILHMHTMQGGNVVLKTKTSNETITIPWNATAAIVKALFEATSDCVSATATGGPWPLTKINLHVTWSQATGDIGAGRYTRTYTAGGSGSCTFQWNAATSSWVLVSDSCNPGPAEEPTTSGTYDGELRAGTCPVSFPPPASGTRNTQSVAVVWDTGTGLVSSAIGYRFGMGNSSAPSKLISETAGTVPSFSGLPQNGVWPRFIAGASNSVLVFPNSDGGGSDRGQTVEAWTVAATWSRIWQRYANGDLYAGEYAWASAGMAQSGKVSINVRRRLYNTTEKAGTIADIAAGTFTAFDEPEISTTTSYNSNAAESVLRDSSGTDQMFFGYDRSFDAGGRAGVVNFNLGGSQFKTPSKKLLIGQILNVFGWDSDRIYTAGYYGSFLSYARVPPVTGGVPYAGSISRTYRWRFYTHPLSRAVGVEWRLAFVKSLYEKQVTGWLAWNCSAADLKTAILAVWPENTEGVVSNVRVNPFGATNVTDNVPAISLVEANLDLHFQGNVGATNPFGFIDTYYLSNVQIELKPGTGAALQQDMIAYSATDASVSWSRWFGSKSSANTSARGGWNRGSWVIAYGDISDNELP